MKNLASTFASTFLLLVALAPAGSADDVKVVSPWERGEKRAPRAAITTRPPAELPQELRRVHSALGKKDAMAIPRGATTRAASGLERRLITAARSAAAEQVEGPGMRNYFRVGFRHGVLDGLNDPRIGRREFRVGLRDGELDREARRTGRRLGTDAAVELGARDAEAAVEAQFRDLEIEPAFAADAPAPAWAAPAVVFDVPQLDDLFAEFPYATFAPLRSEFDLYLSGWGWSGARLHHSSRYADVYDSRWDDAGRAFRRWVAHPRNARLIRGLPEDERRRLEAVFMASFDRNVNRLAATRLNRAWNLGLERGWDYGCFIREEMEYRTGFAKGFRRQASLLSKAVFRSVYPREFRAVYGDAFERWSAQAVPAIGSVTLVDGNDDGVFELGERVLVDVELINFGGASGEFSTSVHGGVLTEIDTASVVIPRRSSVIRKSLLEAVIGVEVRPRTRTALLVRLGEATRDVALSVNRPLEWVGASLRTRRDNLAGRVEVELEVRNLSRRVLDAAATMSSGKVSQAQEVPPIRPLSHSTVRFELDGLSPLDLIAGQVSLDLFLDAEGVEQDRMTVRLSETATDLGNRDLPRLVRRMTAEGATPVDAARVRDLVLARLRVDWRAAVRASGNPYKRDYRSRGDRTALGELVQLARTIPTTGDQAELFDGLSRDVLVLAKDLPGPHPLLRKYVRRLARRLP